MHSLLLLFKARSIPSLISFFCNAASIISNPLKDFHQKVCHLFIYNLIMFSQSSKLLADNVILLYTGKESIKIIVKHSHSSTNFIAICFYFGFLYICHHRLVKGLIFLDSSILVQTDLYFSDSFSSSIRKDISLLLLSLSPCLTLNAYIHSF